MTVANTHGWEFVLPHDVTVLWDGVNSSDSKHVQILSGANYNNVNIASTVTANGTITFHFNIAIETDKNHYCLLSGPPNYPFTGAQPLNAVWRSDYYNYNEVNFCWKITVADRPITFPKGMPVMFLQNYPIGLLESTEIAFGDYENNPELKSNTEKYATKKQEFYKEAEPWTWSNFYKKGIGPNDERFLDSIFRVKLMEP